jgi:asparagine synthetase B (glutamine-hydrolysing)
MSLNDACAMISHAMEELVIRLHARTQEPLGLGLSGGHDSRVILSALAHKKVPYEPLTRIPDHFNDRVARALCSVVKKEPRLVEVVKQEMPELRRNVFADSDGQYFDSLGFAVLGKACQERQVTSLMFGFTGDVISGDQGTPAPQYLRGIEELAPAILQQQLELLSFDNAVSVLHGGGSVKRSLVDTATREWARSFPDQESHEGLLEVAMWQAMANRNVKRVRFSMIPAARYAQIIFPYLDNRVLDAYFRLPIEFLYHQRAHCYAGFHRFPEFGNYRACPYPISLRNEARFPLLLYRMRLAKRFFARFTPTNFKQEVSERLKDAAEEVAKSSLFDARAVRALLEHGRISPRSLRRLRNLVRFHNVYVQGTALDEA